MLQNVDRERWVRGSNPRKSWPANTRETGRQNQARIFPNRCPRRNYPFRRKRAGDFNAKEQATLRLVSGESHELQSNRGRQPKTKKLVPDAPPECRCKQVPMRMENPIHLVTWPPASSPRLNCSVRIGEIQELRIEREMPQGLYLTDGIEEVLLPRGMCPSREEARSSIRVFVHTDSEDRPVATTKMPKATIGQFARLRVVSTTAAGAFLDWGLDKDLFCPLREQHPVMIEGHTYLVRVYLDEVSRRVTCTTRLAKFIRSDGSGLAAGQKVKIIVAGKAAEMISVIINDSIRGSIFPDEWHQPLGIGDIRDAYVKSVRQEDGKVAISMRPQGYQAVLGEREKLIYALNQNGGSLPFSDKSSPEEIQEAFGLSKGAFKKLIGALYREGVLLIEPDLIKLKPDA